MKEMENECVNADAMKTLPPGAELIKSAIVNGGAEFQRLKKEYSGYVDKQIADCEETIRRNQTIAKESNERIRQNEEDKVKMLRLEFDAASKFADKAETEADREKLFNKMIDISNQLAAIKGADTEVAKKEEEEAKNEIKRDKEKREALIETRKQDDKKGMKAFVSATVVTVGAATLVMIIRKWGPSIAKALTKTTK